MTAFQNWLATQVETEVMAGATQESIERAYWTKYTEEGYRKGAGRAFDDTKKPYARGYVGAGEPVSDFYKGTRYQFLESAFARPVAVEKVRLLAGRVFTDLKGIDAAMSTQISRTLTDGLVQGKSPRVLARDLMNRVDKIGKVRARSMARTEIIRAHAEGQLDAMEQLQVEKVGVMVEWSTSGLGTTAAGNPTPCDACAPMEGTVMPIKEARGLLPLHPNCMCSYTPANVGEDKRGQKRSKTKIQKAMDDSVRATMPKIKKRTLAEQKGRSTWPGATRAIAKRRPHSVLEGPKARLPVPSKREVVHLPSKREVVHPPSKPRAAQTEEQWRAGLSKKQVETIHRWEEDPGLVEDIRRLQAGKEPVWYPKKEVQEGLADLESVLKGAPDYEGTVYRGVKVDVQYKPGSTIRMKELSSATKDQDVASYFASTGLNVEEAALEPYLGPKTIMEIRTKSGVDIRAASTIKEQSEVLLRPNRSYRVIRSEMKTFTGPDGKFAARHLVLEEGAGKEPVAKVLKAVEKQKVQQAKKIRDTVDDAVLSKMGKKEERSLFEIASLTGDDIATTRVKLKRLAKQGRVREVSRDVWQQTGVKPPTLAPKPKVSRLYTAASERQIKSLEGLMARLPKGDPGIARIKKKIRDLKVTGKIVTKEKVAVPSKPAAAPVFPKSTPESRKLLRSRTGVRLERPAGSLSDKMARETPEILNEQLEYVNRYPRVSGRMEPNPVSLQFVGKAGRRSGGFYEKVPGVDIGSIQITTKGIPAVEGKLNLGGWNVSSESIPNSIRHEYGHGVFNQGMTAKETAEWVRVYNSKAKSFWHGKVSEYGATDAQELFAESFCAYTHPEYRRGMLPKIVEEYLDTQIK